MRGATVYLDTIGYSGFNTAIQAVECGLPIVTRDGRYLRGRFASGILRRLGLPELVASTEEEYVGLAVRMCKDPDFRERVRGRIEASSHLLFRDTAPVRALEDFLVASTRTIADS
jgi:predicted O-linked N-acetylglucosamine transferase (SPINDLY family)